MNQSSQGILGGVVPPPPRCLIVLPSRTASYCSSWHYFIPPPSPNYSCACFLNVKFGSSFVCWPLTFLCSLASGVTRAADESGSVLLCSGPGTAEGSPALSLSVVEGVGGWGPQAVFRRCRGSWGSGGRSGGGGERSSTSARRPARIERGRGARLRGGRDHKLTVRRDPGGNHTYQTEGDTYNHWQSIC